MKLWKCVCGAISSEIRATCWKCNKANPMLHRLWISHPKLTVRVGVDEEGVIVETAPVVEKFLGQPMENLFRWLQSMGPGLEVKEL